MTEGGVTYTCIPCSWKTPRIAVVVVVTAWVLGHGSRWEGRWGGILRSLLFGFLETKPLAITLDHH